MKKILLTGGAGFVGSHTCLSLLQQKYKVIILDSFVNSSGKSLNSIYKILSSQNLSDNYNLELIKGEISDEKLLKDIFDKALYSDKPIEGVIHFAGLKSLSESINNPLKYWESNVGGTINLLKVMDYYNCRKIIFSSSASIYGLNKKGPIKEDGFIDPITPYGSTKLTIESFLKNLYSFQKDNWNIINLRYFNPIGAHPTGIIGEEKTNNTNNVFPLIIDVAFSRKTLEIFGNDWETFDGTCIRDFIHVLDVAEAHIKAFQFLNKDSSQFLSLNIGTGNGTSVLELIKIFERVNNIKVNYVFGKRRVGDVPFIVADNSYAKKILNWKPTKSLEDMCRDGWKWKVINPNGYE